MNLRERAEKALRKRARHDPDIDIESYELSTPEIRAEELPWEDLESFYEKLGFRGGETLSYVQVDERVYYVRQKPLYEKYGVVVEPLAIALKENSLARRLAWSLVSVDQDKYTAAAYLYGGEMGYFIYVPPGVRFPEPIYTCLGIFSKRRAQFAHNIVYLGEGAEAYITTGCMVPHGVEGGLHIGVSEFYVSRGAKLVYTMLHSWVKGVHVRPRTSIAVEEGGRYVSYYAVYSPVGSLQAMPDVRLSSGASAEHTAIVAGSGGGVYDIGSRALLLGRGSSAELVSRVVASSGARVVARADLRSSSRRTRGHIECLGLLLDDKSYVSSIPILESEVEEAELTHEAAIGFISGEKIEYLMTKGFSEEEARAILLRGFLSVEAPGLPERARREVERIIDYVVRRAVG